MWRRIQGWWTEHNERFWLFLGVLLVGALCFEAGLLQGKTGVKTPVVVTIPSASETDVVRDQDGAPSQTPPRAPGEPVVANVSGKADCIFVGSKNSNKYHVPTCAVAKRIKPENRVCFASKEEAARRGYVPSCLK